MQKGIPVPELIARFFAELHRWPVEPDGINFTQAQIRAICEHIHTTGDCLWHAQFVVMNWKACYCANCRPPVPNIRTVYEKARPVRSRNAPGLISGKGVRG
jgi:hypothetical protein